MTATPETQRQQSIIIMRQPRHIGQLIEIRKEKRMKEQYDAPKTEVILLEEENIILTSGGGVALSVNTVDDNPEGAAQAF